jgi:hypothetical protein
MTLPWHPGLGARRSADEGWVVLPIGILPEL